MAISQILRMLLSKRQSNQTEAKFENFNLQFITHVPSCFCQYRFVLYTVVILFNYK